MSRESLSTIRMGRQRMEKIAEALQQNRSVSKVHYSHNFGMEDSAAETLARALEKSDSVCRVDINHSDLREAEVEAIAEERVEHNSSVTQLCLVDSPGNCRHSRGSQTQRRHHSDRSERQQHHSRRHQSCV